MSIVTTKEIQVARWPGHTLAGSGGILWFGQVGLERIAKGLEVIKASDHMANMMALNMCSELSA